jgi:hypothetical protein
MDAASKMTPEALRGKIVRGVLHEHQFPEYTEAYQKIVEDAMARKKQAQA